MSIARVHIIVHTDGQANLFSLFLITARVSQPGAPKDPGLSALRTIPRAREIVCTELIISGLLTHGIKFACHDYQIVLLETKGPSYFRPGKLDS